jgi:hypothetical protein
MRIADEIRGDLNYSYSSPPFIHATTVRTVKRPTDLLPPRPKIYFKERMGQAAFWNSRGD